MRATILYLQVVNEDFPEAVGQHVLGRFGGTITNLGHQVLPLELPAHSVVNTFGFAPVALKMECQIIS